MLTDDDIKRMQAKLELLRRNLEVQLEHERRTSKGISRLLAEINRLEVQLGITDEKE